MTFDEVAVALHLDDEERALMESIENDQWFGITNIKEEIKRYQDIARAQIARQKIEINLSL
jgi:hypothetical protein